MTIKTAQFRERKSVHIAGVTGSSPVSPTIQSSDLRSLLGRFTRARISAALQATRRRQAGLETRGRR